MDVKSCLLSPGRKVPTWEANGLGPIQLADLVEVLYPRRGQARQAENEPDEHLNPDLIVTADSDHAGRGGRRP